MTTEEKEKLFKTFFERKHIFLNQTALELDPNFSGFTDEESNELLDELTERNCEITGNYDAYLPLRKDVLRVIRPNGKTVQTRNYFNYY